MRLVQPDQTDLHVELMASSSVVFAVFIFSTIAVNSVSHFSVAMVLFVARQLLS